MKLFFLLVLFFLAGCTSFSPGGLQDGTSFQCPSFKEARGVIVDFIQYAPPEEIREGKPFSIGLKFANYLDEVMSVDLSLQDTVDVPDFPDEGVHETIVVESAFVDEEAWRQPGCRLSESEGLTELTLGPYVYQGVDFDDQTAFVGTLQYPAVTEASFPVCMYNPAEGGGSGCPLTQSYSPSSLGYRNEKAPVLFTSVEKRLIGSSEGVTLQLFFTLDNLGGGRISGDGVDFLLDGGGMTFTCYSDFGKSTGSQQLRLQLDEEPVDVECETFLTLDRVQASTVMAELHYTYSYPFRSDTTKIIDS